MVHLAVHSSAGEHLGFFHYYHYHYYYCYYCGGLFALVLFIFVFVLVVFFVVVVDQVTFKFSM